MLQTAADITASVHKFETILHQFKRDNLNEVDQSHYQKIMGLSVRQMNALGALNRLMTNRQEGIPLKTLAHYLRMSIPSTSLLVDSMVKKGLFDRKENPRDRRSPVHPPFRGRRIQVPDAFQRHEGKTGHPVQHSVARGQGKFLPHCGYPLQPRLQ